MSRKHSTSAYQGRSDQDILNLFLEKNRDLAMTSLGKTGIRVMHQISYTREGIATTLDQPDEDAVRSFLLTLRQFVADGEPLSLGHVFNICFLHLGDEVLKDQIKKMRNDWAAVRRGWGTIIVHNNVEYSGAKIFDLWVDGWYFHSDAEKKKVLDQVDPFTREWLRGQFIGFIIGISCLVQELCQIILSGFVEDPAKGGFILLSSA